MLKVIHHLLYLIISYYRTKISPMKAEGNFFLLVKVSSYKKHSINNFLVEKWAKCYRHFAHGDTDTNMYLER